MTRAQGKHREFSLNQSVATLMNYDNFLFLFEASVELLRDKKMVIALE